MSRLSDRDLYEMGKVWGLMKYYHPAVSQGKADWDAVLLQSLKDESKYAAGKMMNQWMSTADQGKFNEVVKKDHHCDSITLRNFNISWIKKLRKISPESKARLLKIAAQPKNVGSFYSNLVANSNRFSSANEKVYDTFTAEIKMLELFRIWNAIEYFYPYKYLLDHQWDDVLKKYIPIFRNIKNKRDYQSAIMLLSAELQDTHTRLENTYQYNVLGEMSSPFVFQIVDNKVLITGIKNEAKMKKAGLEVGDLITKINGKTVLKNINEKSKYFAYSNESVRIRQAYSYLFSGGKEVVTVEGIKKDGKVFKTTVERIKRVFDEEWDMNGIPNYHLTYKGKTYHYLTYNEKESRLNPSVQIEDKVYFEFSSLRVPEIPALMETYKNAKGLVFDLRSYNDNGSLIKIFDYLMNKPEHFGIMTQADFTQPGKFCFVDNIIDERYKFAGKINPNSYKGQVVVLINEYTQSAEELWAMIFKKVPGVIFIGSQTAGADGNETSIKLTDGNRMIFSGLGIYYPDGGETQRIGIKPDIIIRPTVESIRNEEDLLLLKAFEVIDQKK
ncbi:S41 family peptidase [Chryseobacterium sp. SSA4.19]|uniref:S41 family peptidase n=1 Tax=Chryseobacterium sp. SSA4.19 TaxID=2919915 RepID=UPI001F4F63B7|nr:S41 family peptidase [Chryseobacterium sp. SSA4.19]MCJ8155554.1 S41 family peptidase [Chryseobacterium sp. SSA4.19]